MIPAPGEFEIVTDCPLCADTGEGPNELVGTYEDGGIDDRGVPYGPLLVNLKGCRHADAYMDGRLAWLEDRTIQAALDGQLAEEEQRAAERAQDGSWDTWEEKEGSV